MITFTRKNDNIFVMIMMSYIFKIEFSMTILIK